MPCLVSRHKPGQLTFSQPVTPHETKPLSSHAPPCPDPFYTSDTSGIGRVQYGMTHTSRFFLQCWAFGMSWGCNAIKAERICTLKPFTLLMSLLKQETRSWWGGAAQASRTERHFVLLCRFPHNFPSFLVWRLMSRALRGALSPADPQTADEASREMSTETSQMRWLLPRVAMPPGIVSPSKIPKDLKRPLSTIPTRGQGTQRP